MLLNCNFVFELYLLEFCLTVIWFNTWWSSLVLLIFSITISENFEAFVLYIVCCLLIILLESYFNYYVWKKFKLNTILLNCNFVFELYLFEFWLTVIWFNTWWSSLVLLIFSITISENFEAFVLYITTQNKSSEIVYTCLYFPVSSF